MFKRILPEAVVVDRVAQRQSTRLVIQWSWVPSLPVHLGQGSSEVGYNGRSRLNPYLQARDTGGRGWKKRSRVLMSQANER